MRYDRATGKETVFGRVGNIPLTTPGHGAGLSYLPSNELLIVFTRGDVFASDPKDNVAKHLVTIPDMNFLTDAASAVFPNFYTKLNVEKFANGSKEAGSVKRNDIIEYQMVVSNTGNLAADNVILTDSIPEGTDYVPNSTKLNGSAVSDIDGQSPLVTGLKVKSSSGNANEGVILTGEENAATISFQVRVRDDAAFDKEILNTATVTSPEGAIQSNEVINSLNYDLPVLESRKTAIIEEKAEGNTDTEHAEVGDTLTYTIEARNSVENSFIKNLAISDTIPEGLEYVPGTLTVDGQAVTDTEDDDAGHSVNGVIAAQFGDVTDTEWHAVAFQVVVGEGQASKDIVNIATVSGDNISVPDKPEHEVIIYPRAPVLESKKTASIAEKGDGNSNAEAFQIGDTIEYTIQGRNIVTDSVVENFEISDELPEGLTYVDGSLDVSHNGTGKFDNGTIVANFGKVTDTEFRTVTFQATIDSGQTGTIKNVAVVDGDNVDEPNRPESEIIVHPKTPILESDKTAEIAEKAEGNTDSNHPEIGDTLLYTIQTRNTVTDSVVENLTVSDVVPEGLEYVPGSLMVDGVPVTDTEGDDKGHYASGQVVGKFGSVSDTEWHKVQFQAVVQPGQAGKDIINIAVVDGDNIDKPDRPREDVEVYPRNPYIISEKFVSNTDVTKATYEVGDTISYTIRTKAIINDGALENLTITDTLPEGLEYVSGSLMVDGVSVTDAKDDDAGYSVTGQVYGWFGDVTDTRWHTLEFQAVIQTGQGGQTIQNTALVNADNIDQPGEPTEIIVVEPEPPVDPEEPPVDPEEPPVDPEKPPVDPEEPPVDPEEPPVDPVDPPVDPVDPPVDPVDPPVDPVDPPVNPPVDPQEPDDGDMDGDEDGSDDVSRTPVVESKKEAKDLNGGTIQVGDVIEYTIRARNTVSGSKVTNMVISDELPEELKYVPGSLKVDGQSVTDAEDSDKGSYVDGTVSGQFGDITDTDWHTIVFQAEVAAGQAGQTIRNTGEVTGGNLVETYHPYEDIVIGGGSGSHPGAPGDTNDGSSSSNPNQPEGEDSDSTSPDSSQSGGNSGSGETDTIGGTDAADGTEAPEQSGQSGRDGQSGASNESVNAESGDSKGTGNKLPNTATNMYSYLLAECIILLAGLFLLRRKNA
ncbi:Uncharacterized protein conserved in bacteria [Chlamydia abortus]|nr:Uncharacterized protein conserved in bacteria [Chlamydia abortus]